MRALPPEIRVTGPDLVVRTALVADDGGTRPALEVALPAAHADLLDLTATPAVAALAVLAAARGERLVVEGAADGRTGAGADALARRLAEEWQSDPGGVVGVHVPDTSPADGPRDATLCFSTRGLASWSALLDRLDGPPDQRPTHLVLVLPAPTGAPGWRALEVLESHRRAADDLGLPLVPLATNLGALLDAARGPWRSSRLAAGAALVASGLVAGGRARTLVLPRTGGTPDAGDHALAALAPAGAAVVPARPPGSFADAARRVLADDRARGALLACTAPEATVTGIRNPWPGTGPAPRPEPVANCGRCPDCLLALSLALVDGRDPPGSFVATAVDPRSVRAAPLADRHRDRVRALVDDLPPAHEEIRLAWVDAWAAHEGRPAGPHWGDGHPPGLAGPGVPERAAAALRGATGRPPGPAPVPLGWTPGTVPLRPARADHPRVRARAGDNPRRTIAWAVVEHQVRRGDRDTDQSGLAVACQDALGPGLCYLPGVLWAPEAAAVLDPGAVARLLLAARARLWWRDDGDLEPLRVVESIEHGCLPLQVMPDGAARALAAALPEPLAALVVPLSTLPGLDLSPTAVAGPLAAAVDHLLAGSAEADLPRAAEATR